MVLAFADEAHGCERIGCWERGCPCDRKDVIRRVVPCNKAVADNNNCLCEMLCPHVCIGIGGLLADMQLQAMLAAVCCTVLLQLFESYNMHAHACKWMHEYIHTHT